MKRSLDLLVFIFIIFHTHRLVRSFYADKPVIRPFFDENRQPEWHILASIKRVKASGSSYTVYVICNSRGDIDELRNENGSLYARYVYDTWGNTNLPMVVSFILP